MQRIKSKLILIVAMLLCIGSSAFAAGVVDDINAAQTYEQIGKCIEENYKQLGIDISGQYRLIGNHNHLYKELLNKNFANKAEIRNAFNNALKGLIENNYNYTLISGTAGENEAYKSRNLSEMWIHPEGKKAVFVFEISALGKNEVEKYTFNVTECSGIEGEYNYTLKANYSDENTDWLTDMEAYQSRDLASGTVGYGSVLTVNVDSFIKERIAAGDKYIVFELGTDSPCKLIGGNARSTMGANINAYVDKTILLDAERALLKDVVITGGGTLKTPITDGEYSYIAEFPRNATNVDITPVLKNNEDTVKVSKGSFTKPFEFEVTAYDKTIVKTYRFDLVYESEIKISEVSRTSDTVTIKAENPASYGSYYVFAQAMDAKTPVELKYISVDESGEYDIEFTKDIDGCEINYIAVDKYPAVSEPGNVLNESMIPKEDYDITFISPIADNGELLEIISTSTGSGAMVQIFNDSDELQYVGFYDYISGEFDASIRIPDEWENGTYTVLTGNGTYFDKATFELRPLSDDSSLKSLVVEGADFEFDAETFDYVVEIEYGTDYFPPFNATLNDKNASYETEEVYLDTLERKKVNILVTAENGVSNSVYTITYKWYVDEAQKNILDALRNAGTIDEMKALVEEYKYDIGLDTEGDFTLVANPKYVYSALLNQSFERGFNDVVEIFNSKISELVVTNPLYATYSFSGQYAVIRDDFHSLTLGKASTVNFSQLTSNTAGQGIVMIDLSGIAADEIDGIRNIKLVLKDTYDANAGKQGYVKIAGIYSENPNWIEEKGEYVIEDLVTDMPITFNEPYELDVTDYIVERLRNSDKYATFMIYDLASRFAGVTNTGENAPHFDILMDNSVVYDSRNIELTSLELSEGELVEAIDVHRTEYTIAVPYDASEVPEIIPSFNNDDTFTIEYPSGLDGEVKMEVTAEDMASTKTYTFKFNKLPPCVIDSVEITENDEGVPVAKVAVSGDYQGDGYVFVQLKDGNTPIELKYALWSGEEEIEIPVDNSEAKEIYAIILDKIPTATDLGMPLSTLMTSYDNFDYEISADKTSADLGEEMTFENIMGQNGAVFAIFDDELRYLMPASASETVVISDAWDYGNYSAVLGMGTQTAVYDFEVREVYDNAYLSEITVDEVLIPGFDKAKYDYIQVVDFGETVIPEVKATVEGTGAEYVITMPQKLPGKAKIEVTAEDKITKKTYTVSFEYSKDCADLSAITVSGGVLGSTFRSDVLNYNATVYNKNSYSIKATPKDERATVNISYDSRRAIINVIAADGITTKEYTVNISFATTGGNGGGTGGGGGGGGSSMSKPSQNVSLVPAEKAPEQTKPEDSETNNGGETPFTDIEGHWAKDTILSMYQKGLVAGIGDNKFSPESNVTRAEFCTMLVRFLGIDLADYEPIFTDIAKDDWYSAYVYTANKSGLVSGYDGGVFSPLNNITREEMAKMAMSAYEAVKAYEYKTDTTSFADDADISEWAKKYVGAAAECGIVSGIGDNTFSPKANATRAQAAAIIEKLANAIK